MHLTAPLYALKRWMYRTGRPNRLARVLNRISAMQSASRFFAPDHWATLEVPGRRTGRVVSVPLVVTDYEGEHYLVSMLGPEAGWVRNVEAAGGRAVLRHGVRVPVRLEEVEVARRGPILRRYLRLAPGARPHFPVDRRAPLAEFARIAGDFPVFRIVPEAAGPHRATQAG